MATIRENGAPTKHTVGATGDIYEDATNGKKYICGCIYSDSMGVKEYEWKETVQGIEDISEEVPDSEQSEETPVTEEEVIEEKKPEQPENNQQYDRNRNNNRNWNGNKTQYNKQYRPNNK